MKKVLIALLFVLAVTAYAQNMETYCCAPPYVMTVVKPNIQFVLDMTGSMLWRANGTVNGGQYDPAITYYGYFDDSVNYYYGTNKWWIEGYQPGGAVGPIPGNILNWAIMSRVDVLRKVLSGGKGQPPSQWPKHTLNAEGESSYWPCYINIEVGGTTYGYRFSKPDFDEIRIRDTTVNTPDTIPLSATFPTGIFRTDVDVPAGHPAGMGGVLRQICDKDYDGDFDGDAPRVSIMFFSTTLSHFELARQYYHSDGSQAVSAEAYMNDINNEYPNGGTPVAKAVFNSICYHAYVDIPGNYYLGGYNCMGRGHKYDPYYSGEGASLQPVWCRKSFVILIGDGESNSDSPVISDYSPPLEDGPFARNLYNYDNMDENQDHCFSSPHHPADDYAYFSHITDLRPDLADSQYVTFYAIFAFGQGDALFEEIAKDGGFDDQNGDCVPQQSEYDADGDGVPDNYFAAAQGHELEAAIIKIVQDIMAKVSSSSGVSVVTTGSKNAGTTVQAQFYPRRNFPTGEDLEWIGSCQSLWLDPYGWLREDTDADAHLHLINDYVIKMEWDAGQANVMITRMQDTTGTGIDSEFVFIEEVPIEELKPVWDGGKWLHLHPPGDRNVLTFADNNYNGIIEGGEIIHFSVANAGQLWLHLGVASVTEAETTIAYVLGTDYTGFRPRTADGTTWKLGDIINGGAVAVQSPIERYDFIYGDQSYIEYYDQYKTTRRQAVYVGGNDGMLHCFNGGVPVEVGINPLIPMRYDPAGYDLGAEIWGYVPKALLPHLKWLQNPLYCHVYYSDLKVYVTDAKIFPDDAVHPEGWGTILVGGARLGGMPISANGHTYTSSYFALDVTDPANPVPLWEFTDPDLALTVCYSTVVKVDDHWYLAFGSGPQTCSGECTQRAYVFVLDLETGTLLRKWELPDDEAFITNIFGVDWGLDYTVDRLYMGTCHYDNTLPGDWGGKVYRIETHDDVDVNNWDTTMVMDLERPITAEGSIATDDYDHLWVYYGTGRFFSEVDEIDYTVQRYIGFRDDTTLSAVATNLLDVTDVHIDTLGQVNAPWGWTSFEALIDTVNTIGGWYRDIEGQGERNLTTTLVFGGAVLYTTFLPTGDICSYGGQGNLYALFYRTGTAYTDAFLLAGNDTLYNPILVNLGQGMPSEPALYVSSDQTKVFIQAGGGIVSPETGIPGLPKSGVILWKGR